METNTITIKNLLSHVSIINKKYEDISKITGENFNIFQILRVETDEVRLHSRFIAELLKPYGIHDQGILFLKLFVQKLGLNEYTDEQLKNTRIEIEESIGDLGRIDIVVKPNKGKGIVIENKINAIDQDEQLIRYKKMYKDAHLFYLTKDGKMPDKLSITDKVTKKELEVDKDYFCISYNTQILDWLTNCHLQSFNHPLIRETISQYITVIRKLTNQSLSKNMSNDIKDIIKKDSENFIAAAIISTEMNLLLANLNEDLLKRIKIKIENKYNVKEKSPFLNHKGYFFYFFKYDEFKFYIRVGLEYGMSIWLVPAKGEGSLFTVADDNKIKDFKNVLKNFPGYNVENNPNYTGWVISKNNFVNCPNSDKYKFVNEISSDKILDDIVSEVGDFVTYFKNNVSKSLEMEFSF